MQCEMTHEDLSRHLAGELGIAGAVVMEAHLASCPTCGKRRHLLQQLERDLQRLPRRGPSEEALARARQALLRAACPPVEPEIMTLEEVARFLRIRSSDLEELILELPVFELAGQLRLRRQKLLEWIEARERVATGRRAGSLVMEGLTEIA